MTEKEFEKARLETCSGSWFWGAILASLIENGVIKTKSANDTNNSVDIHKIIDDAMEKKDRTVCIFITDSGVTVHVDPIVEHKAHWIPVSYKNRRYIFKCSECGAISKELLPYCPFCGEKLACPGDEEFNTLTNHQDASDFESLKGYLAKEDSADEMSEV